MSLTPDSNAPLNGLGSSSRSVPAGPVTSAGQSSGADALKSAENGVAFRALLERLEERASNLEVQSKSVEDASGLAGAVDTARASLEDAVSLSEELLEAYREALQQRGVAPGNPSERPSGSTETRS